MTISFHLSPGPGAPGRLCRLAPALLTDGPVASTSDPRGNQNFPDTLRP